MALHFQATLLTQKLFEYRDFFETQIYQIHTLLYLRLTFYLTFLNLSYSQIFKKLQKLQSLRWISDSTPH